MRLDRVLTLAFDYSGFEKRKVCVPVLMYHSIKERINADTKEYYCTEITPAGFEMQMEYLFSEGYKIIRLRDISTVFDRTDNDFKSVIITFDDGYHDFYKYAFPILKKYNIPATVFVPSGLIGRPEGTFEGKQLMDWRHILDCSQHSIDIGSHSLTHGKLFDFSENRLENELKKSREIIENFLQKQVDTFSYPFRYPEENKEFVRRFRTLLKNCGYRFNVTTRIGCVLKNDDLLQIKRIPVNHYDDITFFKAKLRGCYDWLYIVQYYVKLIRSMTGTRKV